MALPWSLLLCVLAAPRAGPETVSPPRPVSHTAADVRRLAREPGGPHPLRLTGVVTYADPSEPVFYLQDETAGVLVRRMAGVAVPRAGDRVAVDGAVKPASFPPELEARTVTRLGDGRLPEPMPCELDRQGSRWLDGQFVEARAVVASVHEPTQPGPAGDAGARGVGQRRWWSSPAAT